jgi:uncharacterized protein
MSDPNDSLPPLASQPPSTSAIPPKLKWISSIFWGPNGLRAGWRLIVASAICFVILAGFASVGRLMRQGQVPQNPFSPDVLLAGEGTLFGIVLAAAWIMSKLEGRRLASYGLPWHGAFGIEFWTGTATGFAAISILVGALRVVGVFRLGSTSLHGAEVLKYAMLWACALLAVAFFEEYAFRGYALFTLTTGITFWPAALLCSAIFGSVHLGNSGETRLGALSAGLIGLFFCLLLRKTGTLWMPIGFHAAWDWGETFFYGVPDSGQVAPGHLFNATLSGPQWLTGGTVGPEASWLCIILILALLAAFSILLRGTKYPDAAAIPDPRRPPSVSTSQISL